MKNVIVINCLIFFVCALSFGEYGSESMNRSVQSNEKRGVLQVDSGLEIELAQNKSESNHNNMLIQSYDGHKPTERELAVIKGVMKDDFLVNDEVTIGMAEQLHPSIAIDAKGNFVICWEDYRNKNYDIYYQRYDSNGVTQGANLKANDDIGTANQISPTIAIDDIGNFIICWQDARNGGGDIYYQRYNSSGSAIGTNSRANDTVSAGRWYPSIALNSLGFYIVCWQDYRKGNYDIYYQRYDSSGSAIGTNSRANDDTGSAGQCLPSIAICGMGTFVICWHDSRNGNLDIYYQRYDSSGSAIRTNLRANDDTGTAGQSYPSIAIDVIGSFVICWEDYRNGNYDIYYQRYDSGGSAIGTNLRANDDAGTAGQSYPSITVDVIGNFVVCWQDSRNSNDDIYYQRYNSNGSAIGTNSKANDGTGTAYQNNSSIATGGRGSFIICWQDSRNGNLDIYYQQYNSSGGAIGTNSRTNDDTGTIDQFYPSNVIDNMGDFTICWQDHRNSNTDIYYQRYNSSGSLIGINSRANDDTGAADQFNPSIAIGDRGTFVICWQDCRSGGTDIYFQRYDSNGSLIGTNSKANDDISTLPQYYPLIAIGSLEQYIICWNDMRYSPTQPDIYFQRYNSNGSALGANSRVNDNPGKALLMSPSIAIDNTGNFVICWGDYRGNIYYQRYNSSGVAIGSNLNANDDTGSASSIEPSIAMDSIGNFVICWEDDRNGNLDIYYQRYNSSGIAIGSNLKVNDDKGNADQSNPSISIDVKGNFVICWEDYRYNLNSPDIIGQRFHFDGSKWGANYRIVADGPHHGEQSPVVSANSSTIVFSWMDNRRRKWWDIYAKTTTWDWEGVVSMADKYDKMQSAIMSYRLWQNYPNPFNRGTNIRFDLPSAKLTSLRIYDIKGKLIKTLVNENKPAGNYSIKWNGKNEAGNAVPCGIYIYRIIIGEYTSTKTMLIGK